MTPFQAAVEGMLEGLRDAPSAHSAASISGIADAALTVIRAPSADARTVERVARALRAHEWGDDNWAAADKSDREYWAAAARAALAAAAAEG